MYLTMDLRLIFLMIWEMKKEQTAIERKHSNLFVRVTGVELQEIPQLIIIYEIWLQPTSRRFLRELDEAPGGNNLHYILQCLRVPASVTRVWTRKVCRVATECFWNDGSKTQYYIVILDWLQDCSGGLERALESRIRGPLTFTPPPRLLRLEAMVLDLKRVLKSVRRMCLGAAGCLW